VDLFAPVIGVHEPLRRLPLLLGLNLAVVGLAVLGRRAPTSCDLKSFDLIGSLRWLWPLLLPVGAAAAAARLDNSDGNGLAILVIVATIVLIPVCTVLANRLDPRQLNVLLYSSGLSLMLLTSMRSSYIVGFDISSEYFDFHQAVVQGIWHAGHLSPYEAMLSLTVLPASLHAFIGGQDVFIFKFGYPALFALFPVAVFSLGTRFLSRRAAFLAACLVIVQAYFFQQQPQIARQELALLIFAGIMGALLDTSLGRRPQLALVSVLGVTLALCHYSTTYITIVLCLFASLLAVAMSRSGRESLSVWPWIVAALVMSASAVIWYLPVTHSANNVTYVVQALRRSGIQLLPGRRKGENVISAYFNGLREPPPTPMQYQRAIAAYYSKHLHFLAPLAGAKNPLYSLRPAPSPTIADRAPFLSSGLNAAELLVQQIINLLAVVGALTLALRRRADPLSRTIGLVGIGSLAVLAASRLSGALAADYNSSRLFLQCLFILALVEVALLERMWTRLKARSWAAPTLFCGFALILVVAFVGNSGITEPITGGDPPFILYNYGEDYSRIYPSAQEKASAQWLAAAVPPHRFIYADDYGQLRLYQFTGLRSGVFNDVTPLTIDHHAWIFASTSNVVGHRTWGLTSLTELDLAYPRAFLNQYFNIVYSNGSTEVFHR